MWGLLGLLAALPIISVWAGNNGSDESRKEKMVKSVSVIQPITGTWINLAYKDVRNKYTNPQHFDNTDPKLWTAKVRELANMGIEYLVFMEVANEGKAYYPSKLMPWVYNDKLQSPVDAILDEAARHDMKVFMSTGWAKDQDDNLLDPAIRERQLQIMEELASLYKNHKAFYGWYLPVEDCICPIFAEHAVQSVNTLTEKAKSLTPRKKTLISPYGIGLSEFDHPDFEKQMAKLKVDIIAYQDEVGCVRDKFTLPRLKKNWQRMRDIHNRLNIEMWANCETFTWEEGTNDRQSALFRLLIPVCCHSRQRLLQPVLIGLFRSCSVELLKIRSPPTNWGIRFGLMICTTIIWHGKKGTFFGNCLKRLCLRHWAILLPPK